MKPSTPHLLHAFSTFSIGGPQIRAATIINALGDRFRHTILAMDGNFDALAQLTFPVADIQPPASRHPLLRPFQLRTLLRLVSPDLVLTYNWGAIEAVAAARTLSIPVIHAEDGFGPDEAVRLKKRRVWTRRILLRTARKTVVPSRTLEKIARENYLLPRERVKYIPNGVDLSRFHPGTAPHVRKRLGIAEDEVVFGTVGAFRPEKNLDFLLRAYRDASLPNSRLLLVGDGECRTQLERAGREYGLAGRVVFAGLAQDPAEYYRSFDVFVMSSVTEQMPISLLEAMASGLPAICTDAGDTAVVLGASCEPEVIRQRDAKAYSASLQRFAQQENLRQTTGKKNRARCGGELSLGAMVEAYRSLYLQV